MLIPKFGLGGGWGPVTLSGGAAFRFPIVRWFGARACTFAVPLAGGGLSVASRLPTYGRPYLSLYPLREFSQSLEAGPYPGQPLSRHWQAARTWDPVLPPDFCFMVGFLLGFALGNPVVDLVWRARERVSISPPDFCHVVGLLLGLTLPAQVVNLARQVVSRN